jgi:hypothetical protein
MSLTACTPQMRGCAKTNLPVAFLLVAVLRVGESLFGRGESTQIVMNDIFVLLAVSAILGVALGLRFHWMAILISGLVLALISATILQKAGFDYIEGISIIVVCLTVNQPAYLIGVSLRTSGRQDD